MTSVLDDKARALLDSKEFATIATIEPDGQPQLSVVWISRDDNDLLVSTTVGRRKHRNLVADPRATILVFPAAAPYSYLEVRGSVTMTEAGGRELIDAHNAKYVGGDRYLGDDGTDNVRVVVRLTPDKVISHG